MSPGQALLTSRTADHRTEASFKGPWAPSHTAPFLRLRAGAAGGRCVACAPDPPRQSSRRSACVRRHADRERVTRSAV